MLTFIVVVKKKYKAKNFAFIVTSTGEKYLNKCLDSILKQTIKPGQIIVSIPNNIEFKKMSNQITIIKSKFRNQVYQRSLAKRVLNKHIKILVQIDSKYILQNETLKKLIYFWSKQDNNVAGVGMMPTNYNLPKVNLLQKILFSDSTKPGKVLKSGFVSAWDIKNNTPEVEWLNGGCVSWKLKFCKDIFSRRYPIIFWSVAEDLIYSFNKAKRYKLLLCKDLKVKLIKTKSSSNLITDFRKGYYFSKIIKNFVKHNKDLSISYFYYTSLISSLVGAIYSILIVSPNKLFQYLGRLVGSLVSTYNYKIK